MLFFDKIIIRKENFQITDEGFLVIPANFARTGIQTYSESQGGRLHRPPEEVFRDESFNSLIGKSVTIEHPRNEIGESVFINPENWKTYEVGQVLTSERSEDFLYGKLIIKDKSAIEYITGKRNKGESIELSCGYEADREIVSGKTESGEEYDGIQRNIKYNHISLVPKGRAGKDVKMFLDHYRSEGKRMKINFFDKAFDIAESDAQEFIKLESEIKKEKEQNKAFIDALEAEKKQLEEKVSKMFDEAEIEKKANEISEIKMFCDGMKIEHSGKSVEQMKESIVSGTIPEVLEKFKAGSKEYRDAMWDCAIPLAKKAIENNKSKSLDSSFRKKEVEDAEFEEV